MFRIGKATSAVCLLQWLLVGCASGPRSLYFDLTESTKYAIVLPPLPLPKIGVIGILVEEHEDQFRHERFVHGPRSVVVASRSS
jgi:hypothetical protein